MRNLRSLAVFCSALAFLAGACGASDDYPDWVVRDFAAQCLAQPGATSDRCICVLEGLEKTYSVEEYLTILQRAREGQPVPPEIPEIFNSCAQEDAESGGSPTTPVPGAT